MEAMVLCWWLPWNDYGMIAGIGMMWVSIVTYVTIIVLTMLLIKLAENEKVTLKFSMTDQSTWVDTLIFNHFQTK